MNYFACRDEYLKTFEGERARGLDLWHDEAVKLHEKLGADAGPRTNCPPFIAWRR